MWSPALPPPSLAAWLTPPLSALVVGSGYLCGLGRVKGMLRANDTRKIFHFTIFSAAAVLQALWGLAAVNLLGGIVALHIAGLLLLGEGNVLYEGLAREEDRPHRSLYIVLPFLATGAGGIAASWLFGAACLVGFLVTGWADAIAEPVGVRWGQHRYRVPNFGGGVSSHRSIEGSLAVLVASFAAALVATPLVYPESRMADILGTAACVALVAALVEAVSHHGTDNFTVQVAASGAAWLFLGRSSV